METTIIQKMVLDEISGKNNAIQSYDVTLWKIRSGFLTLLFAGWGALLSFLGDNAELIFSSTTAMFFVSLGLSLGGLFIDLNYVKRKFRCIKSLRLLLEDAYDHINEPDNFKNQNKWLRISGDDVEIGTAGGYRYALLVPYLIYIVPIISIAAGLFAMHLFLSPSETCL